jgi:hypothetical protein
MPPAGFEDATPATKRPQTYALDSAATGVGELRTSHSVLDCPALSSGLFETPAEIWLLVSSRDPAGTNHLSARCAEQGRCTVVQYLIRTTLAAASFMT